MIILSYAKKIKLILRKIEYFVEFRQKIVKYAEIVWRWQIRLDKFVYLILITLLV